MWAYCMMVVLTPLLFLVSLLPVSSWIPEEERVRLWKQSHAWPPLGAKETDAYLDLQMFREWEIMLLRGVEERWANWHQFVTGRVSPAFTDEGFEVTWTPPEVFRVLKEAVEEGLSRWDDLGSEERVQMLYNSHGLLPKFVEMQTIADSVLHQLRPLLEDWSGLKLVPSNAYGVRLYQNGSSLGMHHDKIKTHVISAIIHIAHSYDDDAAPWPLEIESHRTGRLSSVNLQPGEMLLYESAKCLHGRMTKFKGKYYGSLYLHYAPANKKIWNFDSRFVMEAIPPHWSVGAVDDELPYESGACLTVPSRVADGAPHRPLWGQQMTCERKKIDS